MSFFDDFSEDDKGRLAGPAKWVLDAVESWADKYWLLRETECFVKGRIDGLLIPTALDAHCIKKVGGHYASGVRVCGVEVKVSKQDFRKGLDSGQFDRYAETLGGLYVAGPTDVFKTADVPNHLGHLAIDKRRGIPWKCICKRHPKYRDIEFTPTQMWQLFFRFRWAMSDEARRERERYDKALKRIGERASHKIFAAIREIQKSVEAG